MASSFQNTTNHYFYLLKSVTKLRCKASNLSVVSANPLSNRLHQYMKIGKCAYIYTYTTYKRVHIINFEKPDEDKEEV